MKKGRKLLALLLALSVCMFNIAAPALAVEPNSTAPSVELKADKMSLEKSTQDQEILITALLHNQDPIVNDITGINFNLESNNPNLELATKAVSLTEAFGKSIDPDTGKTILAATYNAPAFAALKMVGLYAKPITEKEVTLMTIKATLKANAPTGTYKIVTKEMDVTNTNSQSVYSENQELIITVAEQLKGQQTVIMNNVPKVDARTSTVTARGDKFTAEFDAWMTENGDLVSTFADNYEYRTTVTLTAEEGYAFASNATVKLAGDTKGQVSNVQVAANGKTLTFTYKYSLVKKAQTITAPASQTVKFGTSFDLSTVCRSSATGATLTYTVDGTMPAGTTLNGSTITAGTTAGEFNIKVNSAAFGDYKAAPEKTIAIQIRDKDSQVFRAGFDTAVTKTYGDSAFTNKKANLSTGNGAITYASNNTNVATVEANTGKVTIVGAGTTTITATAAETADYAATSVSYTLTVNPKKVTKPTASTATFTYNGKEQTYTVRAGNDYTVTGNKATDAGSHTVTVALKDKNNTAWADGTTADLTFAFEIAKATVTVTAKDKTVYLSGTVPELPATPVLNTDYTVTGLAAADNALLSGVTLQYQKDGQAVTDVTTIDTKEAATYDIVIAGTLAPNANYNPVVLKNGTLRITTRGGGGGGGSATVTTGKPSITSGDGGKVVADDKGNVTITPDAGYKVKDVTVNGKSVGAKTSLTGMTTKDKVVVTFEKDDTAVTPSGNFADVPAGHWAEKAVAYVYENGLFQGTSATAFEPNTAMNRGMLVTVLWRLDGKPAANAQAAFADVKSGDYYADAVAWANANGIVKGYTASQFAPNDKVTREQMAAILVRYAEHKGYATTGNADLSAFTDGSQISAYALDGVKWANSVGLMTGRTATTLAPQGDSTRAEVASMIQRFAQNVVK